MIDPRNTQAMYVDSRPDVYGTDAYNKAFGLTPLTYGANNANGDVAKHNTIGLLTGNQVLPGLDMFNRGIDPQQIIKNAGLATAQGQYVNGSWKSSMADSYAARDKRIAALKSDAENRKQIIADLVDPKPVVQKQQNKVQFNQEVSVDIPSNLANIDRYIANLVTQQQDLQNAVLIRAAKLRLEQELAILEIKRQAELDDEEALLALLL